MLITVTQNGTPLSSQNQSPTESDVWKSVGACLARASVPGTLQIHSDLGDAELKLISRGTVKHEDGSTSPSLFVSLLNDTMTEKLERSEYPEAYLTCINPYGNNYKFYWLRPKTINGVTQNVGATYGRIGSLPGERFGVKDVKDPFPSQMYWIRYYEKLSKGYIDATEEYLGENEEVGENDTSSRTLPSRVLSKDEEAEKELYDMLLRFARNVVEKSLAEPQRITCSMIRSSREVYERLAEFSSVHLDEKDAQEVVQGFNTILMELLMICPRRVELVSTQLATSVSDFADILEREASLVNAMEAVKEGQRKDSDTFPGWEGIKVERGTCEERQEVMDLIDPSMRANVKDIFFICPRGGREVFKEFCDQNKITDVRQLMHGSRKENWFSIVQNGLLLPHHNNARKTGQALGAGIYFGNCSIKCSHYANYGTYLLGIFDVAYGKPKKVVDDDHNAYQVHTAEELAQEGKNCIHYHRKGVAWADEIVVFDERAICMRAIVVMNK